MKTKKLLVIALTLPLAMTTVSLAADGVDQFGVPEELYQERADLGEPVSDDSDDNPGYEAPSYQNPAQAHHAANLQEQALANDAELNTAADSVAEARQEQNLAEAALQQATSEQITCNDQLQAAIQTQTEAQAAYDNALASGDAAALEAATTNLEVANQAVMDAQKALDGADERYQARLGEYNEAQENCLQAENSYAEMLGNRTGVLAEEIRAMRQERKMGWGDIAHYLGVPPSYLGRKLGHTKNWKNQVNAPDTDPVDDEELVVQISEDEELQQATKRNTHTGWSTNHGLQTERGNSTRSGMGLAATSGDAGRASMSEVTASAPTARAMAARSADRSKAMIGATPHRRSSCTCRFPMGPVPRTTADMPKRTPALRAARTTQATGSTSA